MVLKISDNWFILVYMSKSVKIGLKDTKWKIVQDDVT